MTTQDTTQNAQELNLFIVKNSKAEQASITDCLEAAQGSTICNALSEDHAVFLAKQAASGKMSAEGDYKFGSLNGNNVDEVGHLIVISEKGGDE